MGSGDPSCQGWQQAILPTKYIFSVTSKYIDSNVDKALLIYYLIFMKQSASWINKEQLRNL